MVFLRKLLFPFSLLYWLVTRVRNFFYDCGVLNSHKFDVPIIAVGNLSVGGTGKTPQIEYLIRLLFDSHKVAILSRGYKRKSKGFVLADGTSDANILGDEPFQFYQKFKNILVAVDADRKNGIEQLFSLPEKPEIILLDDAFQHRRVRAGFYVLLTTFNELYVDDFLLPAGNLRESRAGAKRANVVIVTKCPEDLSQEKQFEIKKKLNLNSNQNLFFSTIVYDDCVLNAEKSIAVDDLKTIEKIIVAGIAKPKPFVDFIKNKNDEVFIFPDHHHFSDNEILDLQKKSVGTIIVTTEKDFVRLQDSVLKNNLFYLPIKTKILNKDKAFDIIINSFVHDFMLMR